MRPAETLLVFANLLTLVVVAVPRLHAARWMGGVVLITIAIALVQVLMEGPRWQMVPAYVLTGLFLFVWLVQSFVPVGGIVKQILTNRLVAGFAIILCIIGLGLSAALPIVLPVFHFPRPSGPYDIGTVTYHWTDISRREVFSPDKQRRRELMVQVWYPARKGTSSSHAPYLPDADAVTTALARLHHLPDVSFHYLTYVTTNAAASVPIADDQPSYPVLIYLEGLTGYRQMSTFQVEELVSHGYIVVGIDQPGVAATVVFPDGHQLAITGLLTQIQSLADQSISPAEHAPQFNGQTFQDGIIPYLAQDVSFTLDQLAALNTRDPKGILTGKLDLEHIGMFGISFGGIVGAQACLQDLRLKACLVMDVWMTVDVVQQGLRQPGMWITRPADTMRLERQKDGGWAEKDIELTQTTMRAVYNRLPRDGYFVQVPGMFHIDFTDLDLLSPIFPIPGIIDGPIGSQRAHEIINAYSLAFFDKHLKGEPQALLDGPVALYPEVIFERRGP
jgi:predicted dienelactone hydrolase